MSQIQCKAHPISRARAPTAVPPCATRYYVDVARALMHLHKHGIAPWPQELGAPAGRVMPRPLYGMAGPGVLC